MPAQSNGVLDFFARHPWLFAVIGALSLITFAMAPSTDGYRETSALRYRAAPVEAVAGLDGWRVTILADVLCEAAPGALTDLERELQIVRQSASAALASSTYRMKLPPGFGPENSRPLEASLFGYLPPLPAGARYEGRYTVSWHKPFD